jgi:hypothetical protein
MSNRKDELDDDGPSEVQADWLAICAGMRTGLMFHVQQMGNLDAAGVALLVNSVETAMDCSSKAQTYDASIEGRACELERDRYAG